MKNINENTKVTLTFGQLKRLVKESDFDDGMKRYSKVVYVPKKEIDRVNRLLDVVYDRDDMESENVPFDATIFSKTVKFDDGFTVEVRVCSGQNNLWSEAVLFDPDGNEVSCADDCSYEHIDGSWELSDDDADYEVVIEPERGGKVIR